MEKEALIIHSARESNILPITSRCDARCIFCSHKNNPPGINVVAIGDRTPEEVERTLRYLDGEKVITIGESATNIIEGEPLCHPGFADILRNLRRRFPVTPVAITTNGHGLSREVVSLLKEMDPIVINLSINSATVRGRRLLMGDSRDAAAAAIDGVKLLPEYGVTFHGSIVAMPHVTGWDDIFDTVKYMDECGVKSMRLFMPAYSNRTPQELKFDHWKMFEELQSFVDRVGDSVDCPLIIEPSYVKNLTPEVSGVVKGSKAYNAGLRRGDVIESVNGIKPRSRVEAWNMIQVPGKLKVQVSKEGHRIDIEWGNQPFTDPGVIMEYDFDVRRMEELKRIAVENKGNFLALASDLGYWVLKASVESIGLSGRIAIHPVKNLLFGGSIGAAGLLSVSDFIAAYEEFVCLNDKPDLLLVPAEPFDFRGFDLMGRHFSELQDKTCIKTIAC